MLSVTLTLAVVLGLMGVALKLLRKYTLGGTARNGAVKMEVLQRVTLGQRQGIAVVRIGTRVLAVSMGDGGVHPVAELDAGDVAAVESTGAVNAQSVAKIADSLRSMVPALSARKTMVSLDDVVELAGAPAPVEQTVNAEPQRISYIAPMEDFQAVLNMAMSGAVRS
jgi:flagellar biogenesis protein FliO